MSAEKTYEMHVPSTLGAEKVAMEFAATIAKSMNFPAERVEDLKTAVAEACTNAIEHGNKLDASTKVGISLTVDQGRLRIAIQDQGGGIGKRPAVPNIESQVEGNTEPGGWGVFLIENLVDEVSFESSPEGTIVNMIIHLEKTGA
jgi:serine/threonine-protein kinase RsbW